MEDINKIYTRRIGDKDNTKQMEELRRTSKDHEKRIGSLEKSEVRQNTLLEIMIEELKGLRNDIKSGLKLSVKCIIGIIAPILTILFGFLIWYIQTK